MSNRLQENLAEAARRGLAFRIRHVGRGQHWLLHRAVQYVLDAGSAIMAVWAAFLLRYDFRLPAPLELDLLRWSLPLALLTPVCVSLVGGYRSTWRFFGLSDFFRISMAYLVLGAGLVGFRIFRPGFGDMGYSIAVLWVVLALLLSGCIRLLRMLDHRAVLRATGRERTLLIGTEETLAGAVRHLQTHGRTKLVGLVADEADLEGRRVAGVPILGKVAELAQLVRSHGIRVLFLASGEMSSVPAVTQVAAMFDLSLRILPSPEDLLNGTVRVNRHVTPEMIRPIANKSQMNPVVLACLSGRTVMVTGAGGSIGSELARQIVELSTEKVILLDQDENALFELMHELKHNPKLVPVIADIRDRKAVRAAFQHHAPQVVLHAAAYKHVPMMEHNPCEAVLNNVCGTRQLTEAAVDFSTERFVMISTDKAVRPSSVMGATKRLAEMVVQSQAQIDGGGGFETSFACVRFGNVLGSRGSVLPLFLRQIATGDSLSVTHSEMTRYFMSIPEAVRLVLQAGTLASSGDVYMLDMGDPVRIMSFAQDVVEQAGLVLDKDIHINVVGMRPGEKIHEQLWSEDAQVTATEFKGVFRVQATAVPRDLDRLLDDLEHAAHQRDPRRVRDLLSLFPIEYAKEQREVAVA